MNKVILMGRLTKDPEVRFSQSNGEQFAIARYSLAVNRRFKRNGEPDADFINCVAFGKNGEFAEKYLKKGMQISVCGSIRVSSWDDQATGQKRYSTEVIIDEHYFAESKKNNSNDNNDSNGQKVSPLPIMQSEEDDLPF